MKRNQRSKYIGGKGQGVPPEKRLLDGARVTSTGCIIPRKVPASGRTIQMRVNGKLTSARRYLWTLHAGPIPPDTDVIDTCFESLCVNIKHLALGNAGSKGKGRRWRRLTPKEAKLLYVYQGSNTETAEVFGVSASVVEHLRTGTTYAVETRALRARGVKRYMGKPGAKPVVRDRILSVFQYNPEQEFTYRDIAKVVKMTSPHCISVTMQHLASEGEIERSRLAPRRINKTTGQFMKGPATSYYKLACVSALTRNAIEKENETTDESSKAQGS